MVSTTDIWDQIILCDGGGVHILCIVGRSAAPPVLPAGANIISQWWQPEVNSDTATYPRKKQTHPSS